MGVAKIISQRGNGIDRPHNGDWVTMEYAGYIYDPSKVSRGYRGKKFDSSSKREGSFTTRIGMGQVIKGWDEGIVNTDGGMTLGEMATFTITSDYAYGTIGFPKYVPPNSTLVFDLKLLAINGKLG